MGLNIENVKTALLKDYREAISKYNNTDYIFYFRNIRPALEWLCKLIVFDVINDESISNDLIDGVKVINKEDYSLEPGTGDAPESSSLAFLATNAIKFKYPSLLGDAKKVKRLKRSIDEFGFAIAHWYGIASEEGSHTRPSENSAVQADALTANFPTWFISLKEVLSKETLNFLSSLPVPTKGESNIQSEIEIERNNDFVVLDDMTNHFEQIPGIKYIAILPSSVYEPKDCCYSSNQLCSFYRIKWSFVVDLDEKTENGLFEKAPDERKNTIRIITDNTSEISGISNMTNWLFAKGRADLEVFDDKKALRETPKLFETVFSKIVKTGLTNDYYIFDFVGSSPKLTRRLFDKLEDVFGSWEAVQTRCKIFSFTKDSSYKEEISEWSVDYGIPVTFVDSSFGGFIHHISDLKSLNNEISTNKLLVRGNTKDLTESRERYRAAGIEFFGPSNNKEERKWDFYSGAEITWDELDQQFDVQREIYRTVKQRVCEIIRTTRMTQVFTLKHRPGSGATTLSRRLAYDIKKEEENNLISCTVIDIRNCSNLKLTEQYLCQLSEETDNAPILAIVEAKRVGREKFDEITRRMSKAAKKVVFFYIEPYTAKYFSSRENVSLLDSTLKNDEQKRFEEKYKQLGLSEKLLSESHNNHKNLEVIDFPLMLRDNETSDNLSSYVSEWMSVLPDNLKLFCAYVGFVFKYSDSGVNQNILKPIWYDTSHSSLKMYNQQTQTAINKLLIEECSEEGDFTGIWRPRYNRFSSFILQSYKTNWDDGLSDFAKNFINLCQRAGELGSDDIDMLYSVFVIRKNADYRAIEDKTQFKNKFSILIKDLDDTERAESLFNTLVNSFPNDAVFRGHFARFLYEKATMIKDIEVDDRLFYDAQENLNLAFELNPDDSDLHHMQGMLYRRKINALSKQFARNYSEDPDVMDIQEIEDSLVEWTNLAYDSFEKSIQLNPASPYGYAAESQLFKESILLGKSINGYTDFSFCETNYVYADYTEKLGNVLDLFEQICYIFKNEGLSQIMNSIPIYESVRLFHQNLIGQNQESIQRYRTQFNAAAGERKKMYGDLLVRSILYSRESRTKSKDTRRAYYSLSNQEKHEIEEVLEYNKNQGDIKCYETLFMLKLYSPEEFSLDEAIDLLKEWERQYTEKEMNGWGYLNACFYLAVCYCAKAIQRDSPDVELSTLSMSYFKKSEEIAKYFDKGTVQPQCYFGDKDDIHCIVDKSRKDIDACTIAGVIHNIKNNKGILRMKCGIDVTFNAKDFDIMRDEGQTLRGLLGFTYSGPGLYNFRPDTSDGYDDISYEEEGEIEPSLEKLQQSYVPVEDLVEEDVDIETEPIENNQFNIKHVGFIDLSQFGEKPKKQLNKKTESNDVVSDYAIVSNNGTGIYHRSIYGKKDYITDDNGHKSEVRSIREGETISDGDQVEFTLCNEPNLYDSSKKYWFALDVHLEE